VVSCQLLLLLLLLLLLFDDSQLAFPPGRMLLSFK
jgi:hypothetical protein